MRAGVTLVVILLLAACSGAPSDSPTPQQTAGETLRILASGLWGDFPNSFAVAAATNAEEYQALRARLQPEITGAEVDFTHELVLYLGMAGSSSCPEQFERLVVDDTSRVYAEWSQAGTGACTDDLAPQGILLAVQRSELPGEPFLFSLRDELICPDCPDFGDQITVDPR